MNILQRIGTAFNLVFKRGFLPEYLHNQFGIPFFGGTNDAGEPVTSYNGEKITTVFNAINVIAQDIATADVQIRRKTSEGVNEIENDHLEKLLDRNPNPYMNAYQFKYCMTFLGESRGESFAWIERDGNQTPIALWPLDPDQVRHMRDSRTGICWYEIQGNSFPTRDIFSYKTFTVDGFRGVSKIVWNAQLIGLKMKTHKYKTFAVGNQTPGFLKGNVNSTQAKEIQIGWKETTAKGETPFLFGEDIDYKQLMFTPEQTDIVLSEKWTDTMTLGIFRMQPVMVSIHEDSNYSNAEQQDRVHVKYTLNAAKMAWEQEANTKLVSEREKMLPSPKYVKFSLDHLLQGDTETFMKKVQTLTTLGIWNADDVLTKLNMPHQKDGLGQKYWIQGAMVDKSNPQEENSTGERMMNEIKEILKKYNGHENGLHIDN